MPDPRPEYRILVESTALLVVRAPTERDPAVFAELAAHLHELSLVPTAEAP